MSNPGYTQVQLAEFDRIATDLGSHDQLTRIRARLRLSKFIDRHGQEKTQRLIEVVRKADAAQ